MRRRFLTIAIVALLAQVCVFCAPTAILVDTSRSIPRAQFDGAVAVLQGMVPGLVSQGPVSVYVFNDRPERLVAASRDPGEITAALAGISQGGRYTLLYDALFAAVKDLKKAGEPGVVLLVTDGKDENSAVTIEDAASRAEEAHVAVVPASLGAAQTLVLRRIAVLTGGVYAGPVSGLDSEALAKAVTDTGKTLAPFPPKPESPAVKTAAPAPAPSVPRPEKNRVWLWFLLVLLLAAVALVAVGILVLLRRVKAPEERVCEECGRPLNIWENECPDCLAKVLSITKPGEEASTPAAEAVPEIDPSLLAKGPPSEDLDNTIVLNEIPVLVLKRGNNPERAFQLPPGQVISVGRDKVNTISVADKTLSAQHFRVVPKEEAYYLADLESTNGTFLDGERITLRELKPGSVIHAGQCDFQFRMEQKRLN